jgi:uncharacterized protein YdhG (YjbR/CyaY superfamily)
MFDFEHALFLVIDIPCTRSLKRKEILPMDVLETYLTSIEDPVKQEKLRALFAAITKKFPDLVPVIKWNQPMFTAHETFIIGFSVSKPHFSVSPETKCLEQFADAIEKAGYSHTDNIFRIRWTEPIDQALIEDMIAFNLKDKAEMTRFWR